MAQVDWLVRGVEITAQDNLLALGVKLVANIEKAGVEIQLERYASMVVLPVWEIDIEKPEIRILAGDEPALDIECRRLQSQACFQRTCARQAGNPTVTRARRRIPGLVRANGLQRLCKKRVNLLWSCFDLLQAEYVRILSLQPLNQAFA